MKLLISLFVFVSFNSLAVKVNKKKEIECLARVIYHEARGEPKLGKLGVAYVTINRVKHHKFPNTVCGVMYDGRAYSFVKKGYNLPNIKEMKQFKYAKKLASQVYHKQVKNPVKNAVFFRTKKYHSFGRPIRKIGNHYFSGFKR